MRYTLNYKGTEAERFARRIVRRVVVARLGPCWEWSGCRVATGYGHFRPSGDKRTKPVRAHRWAWQRVNGPVPSGMELDHLCRNPACVRPSHMEVVTHLENMRRSPLKNPTHCKHGHPFDARNTHFRKGGGRVCRACDAERGKKRHAKR